MPSYQYRPNCSELKNLFSICNIYIDPQGLLFVRNRIPPIGTSKFTGPLFIHVVPLFSKTVFLQANIMSYCSLVISIYSLA